MSKYADEWKEELTIRKTVIENEINAANEESDRTYARSRILNYAVNSDIAKSQKNYYEQKVLDDDTKRHEVANRHKAELNTIYVILEAIERSPKE